MTETEHLDYLAERMKCGEQSAFREFVHAFDDRVFRMFVLRGVPQADADELTGNTLSRAVLKIQQYTPGHERGLMRWVYAVARRVFIDSLRSRRRELAGAIFLRPSAQAAITALDPETAPQEDADLKQSVDEALGQLAPIDREIVRGRMRDRPVSYRDLAASLGITEDAARQRHQRASKRLKRTLEAVPAVRRWRDRFERTQVTEEVATNEENRDD